MGLDNITLHHLASTNCAVVWALGSREPIAGPKTVNITSCLLHPATRPRENLPAIRTIVLIEHRVLLLEPKPRLVRSMRSHQLGSLVAVVVLVGRAIGIPALGEHQDVLAQAERVGEDGDRLQVDVRVVAGGLVGRRAVKVPNRKIIRLVVLLGQGLRKLKSAPVARLET